LIGAKYGNNSISGSSIGVKENPNYNDFMKKLYFSIRFVNEER
jgi:hypothetical protein